MLAESGDGSISKDAANISQFICVSGIPVHLIPYVTVTLAGTRLTGFLALNRIPNFKSRIIAGGGLRFQPH